VIYHENVLCYSEIIILNAFLGSEKSPSGFWIVKIRRVNICMSRVMRYSVIMSAHEGLEGKVPSESYGIEIKGDNKWITLIQNDTRTP